MCDCSCSNVMCMLNCLSIKLKIFFEYFICFLKWFYTFMFLIFVQNAFYVLFFKNLFRGIFTRSSRLRASYEKRLRENWKSQNSYREYRDCLLTILRLIPSCEKIFRQKLESTSFIQRLSRLSHDYFTTRNFSRKFLCFSGVFHE